MRKSILYIVGLIVCLLFSSCMKDSSHEMINIDNSWEGTAPRLIVKGTVKNELGQPLKDIRVDLYGVREETEQDIITYNYSYTNADGEFVITRYRGREIPRNLTLVTTDPSQVYKSQTIYNSEEELWVNLNSSSENVEWNVSITLVKNQP